MRKNVRRNFSLTTLRFRVSSLLYYRRKMLLVFLALSTLFVVSFPIKNVKGAVNPTPVAAANFMSMDANRIATLDNAAGLISVYDIPSGAIAVFPKPVGGFSAPQLYGDKIVIASAPGLFAASSIQYCVLPIPLAVCGPWVVLIAGGLPTPVALAGWGNPVFRGDIVAWPIAAGLSYYSIHAGAVTVVATPGLQPVGVSTNGDIIAFVAGGTLNYLSTSSCVGPCVPIVVPTALPAAAGATSISQNVIAFDEPGPPTRIRYFDVLSGVASPAGTGPIGDLGVGGSNGPLIWDERIVFRVTEANLGFDCNGDAVVSAVDNCLRYWNIRNPNVVLLPAASPPFAVVGAPPFGIYDKYIAYLGAGGVKYVTVPLTGDIDLNGKVDIVDAATLAFCYDKLLLTGAAC